MFYLVLSSSIWSIDCFNTDNRQSWLWTMFVCSFVRSFKEFPYAKSNVSKSYIFSATQPIQMIKQIILTFWRKNCIWNDHLFVSTVSIAKYWSVLGGLYGLFRTAPSSVIGSSGCTRFDNVLDYIEDPLPELQAVQNNRWAHQSTLAEIELFEQTKNEQFFKNGHE